MYVFVVVTGPPASGKSTLSTLLAQELGLPRLAKDTIKRGLLESLGASAGAGDVAESRRVGAAAVRALLALAMDNPGGAVLDSVWAASDSVQRLEHLPGPVVEVFCDCGLPQLRRRYRQRAMGREGRQHDLISNGPRASCGTSAAFVP